MTILGGIPEKLPATVMSPHKAYCLLSMVLSCIRRGLQPRQEIVSVNVIQVTV